MTDIITVPLETLRHSLKEYKKKKVRIKEFPFFVTTTMVHDDYHIVVGPSGGVTVHYDEGKLLSIGTEAIRTASVFGGIYYIKHESGRKRKVVLFPTPTNIPKVLADLEKSLMRSTEQYKQTYLNAKNRLDKVNRLNKEFPEYSL